MVQPLLVGPGGWAQTHSMQALQQEQVPARSLRALSPFCTAQAMERLQRKAERLLAALSGRAIWNVNSTGRGGGVAEMLRSLVAYSRGAGVECNWVVIHGSPSFFQLTKRLHNALHGAAVDTTFGEIERVEYERTSAENASELRVLARPGDIVILHDPQTLGVADVLARAGVKVIWRCHIGADVQNEYSRAALAFLWPYFARLHCCVFSRQAYIPQELPVPARVIAPSIDPLSAKNQPLSAGAVRSILVQAGLLEGPPSQVPAEFVREDGSRSLVTRAADIIRLGRACCEGTPCVVQISRWDRLKDHVGVLHGFARYIERGGQARLILAGPNVHAVADDPEGAGIFDEVVAAFRALPHQVRGAVDLINLPMADAAENAAIVNALQRHASIVVQKSLREGFGLTVSEAMWKAKPVIATRVGGIQDQIEHGVSGILLDDPHSQLELADALARLLGDRGLSDRMGNSARERVRDHFLSVRSLEAFADLITDLL
ncbi:MAG: glycosyltransferase [Myxococcales bacterium]